MFNKLKCSALWLLLAALFFTGCKSDDEIIDDEPDGWPQNRKVYVVGFEGEEGNSVARFWENGKKQPLAGTSDASLRAEYTLSSQALSVFVSDDDTYVAGYDMVVSGDKWVVEEGEVVTHGDPVFTRARLWKNGEIQNIPNTAYSDRALSVFVSEGDVYVLVCRGLFYSDAWSFKVYKNGEELTFSGGNSSNPCIPPISHNMSLFVSDGDVYVAGSRETASGIQACLWKNGVLEDLADESIKSFAHSVFVSGKDVYVAGSGYYRRDNTHFSVAQIWKNGKVEHLTDELKNGEAFSVYLSEGDVYVAGHDNYEAKLWKNGIVQKITDDEMAKMYLSVFVSEGNVYLSGYTVAVREVYSDGTSIRYLKAALWENGKKLALDSGDENSSRALSVFVK